MINLSSRTLKNKQPDFSYKVKSATRLNMTRHWTEDEKTQFLVALKHHGDSNLEALQLEVPCKSINDIRNAIEYYKKRAQTKWLNKENRRCDEVRKWIDVIEKLSDNQQGLIQDLIPRALKYIALFEKTQESDIDLSEVYLFLSNMTHGQPSTDLPERAGYFVYRCLVKLAENLQKQNLEEAQSYLNELKSLEDLQKKSDDPVANPLSVPDKLLKLTSLDTSIDITQ